MTPRSTYIVAAVMASTGIAAIAAALGSFGTAPASERVVVVPGGARAVPAGVTGVAPRPATAAAARADVTFTPSNADFPNPERGFYRWSWNNLDQLTADDVNDAFASNYRLMFVLYRLDAYLNGDIPAGYLTNLQRGFDRARAGGVKLVIRAVYNYPDNETEYQNAKDATLSRTKAHVAQLKALFERNSDVIAFMQAGFIGAWGEWHTSSNGLTTPANRTQVQDALLAALPTTRFVQFRYPEHLQGWAATLPSLDSAIAGSFRLGFHNDCFLASATDVGTYSEDATIRAQQRDYAGRLTALTPFGGETCNPADEDGAVPRTTCSDITNEGARYHLTYLNEEYYRPLFHDRWTQNGCMADVRRKMGYRFELTRASHADTASRGAAFDLTLGVRNSGWARLYNPRPVQIVLRHTSSGAVRRIATTGADPRRWLPATTASDVRLGATIPSDLPAGTYSVMVALPDAAAALATQPRYAIRFANADAGGQSWQASLGAFATGTTVTIS